MIILMIMIIITLFEGWAPSQQAFDIPLSTQGSRGLVGPPHNRQNNHKVDALSKEQPARLNQPTQSAAQQTLPTRLANFMGTDRVNLMDHIISHIHIRANGKKMMIVPKGT